MAEAHLGAGVQSEIVNATGRGFDPLLDEMKYVFKFIFSFLRSGVKAQHDVVKYTAVDMARNAFFDSIKGIKINRVLPVDFEL